MTATEIPDMLVLAAIDRAVRHGREDSQAVPKSRIIAHLDIRPRSRLSIQVGTLLKALTTNGLVEPRRELGMDVWRVTSEGRWRLDQALAACEPPELPEAPQHRAWRKRRALAAQKMELFRAELDEALSDGWLLLQETNAPANSDMWDALGKRLQRCCSNVASSIYCLHEWNEPRDDRADRGHAGNWHLRDNVLKRT